MAETLTPTQALAQLRTMYEGIRDEHRTYANTATRIGNAFLALLSYLAGAPYLRKDTDDTAAGLLTLLMGCVVGESKQIRLNPRETLTSLIKASSRRWSTPISDNTR